MVKSASGEEIEVKVRDMKTLTVIIPVYNACEETKKCLKSVIGQSYRNLEIICVDDGSTDGSEQVVDEFAKKDNRVNVVHQKNRGESNARNTGLKIATGDYIAFCDCDDWLEQDMYETLVQTIEQDNVDLAIASWYRDEGINSQEIKNRLPVSAKVFGRDELLQYLYMRDSYRGFAYMWDKLYKREVLHDKQGKMILFDETLRLGGDVLYLAEIALNVKRAKYIDRAFYHYNQREGSGCHTKDAGKLRDWLRAYEMVLERLQEENVKTETIDYVKRFMAYHSSNATEIAVNQGNEKAKKEFQAFMRLYQQEYLSLNKQYPERIQRYQNLLNQ